MAVLMTGLEGVMYIQEFREQVSDYASTFVKMTANQASNFIDKLEPMKKARTGLVSAFSLISNTLEDTIDGTIEDHLLPAFGLPVDGIPVGKTADQYFQMAERYEAIGLPEPTKEALELALESAPTGQQQQEARNKLRSRIPKIRVSADVHKKMLAASRHHITGNQNQSREIYHQLIVDEPKFEWPFFSLAMIELTRGELDRSKDLVKSGAKLNSNSIKSVAARARIQLAEWKISELEKSCSRMDELEPDNNISKSFREIISMARQHGLA